MQMVSVEERQLGGMTARSTQMVYPPVSSNFTAQSIGIKSLTTHCLGGFGTSIELENQANIPLLNLASSTKYQEAQLDPFAQLLNRARMALRPSSGSQRLLVICGYSFGDNTYKPRN